MRIKANTAKPDEKARVAIELLKDAVYAYVKDNKNQNTAEIGRALGIDDLFEGGQKGWLQHGILNTLQAEGLIDNKPEGGANQWYSKT